MAETTEPMSALIERLESRGCFYSDGTGNYYGLDEPEREAILAALKAGQEYVDAEIERCSTRQTAGRILATTRRLEAAEEALVRAYRKEIPNG